MRLWIFYITWDWHGWAKDGTLGWPESGFQWTYRHLFAVWGIHLFILKEKRKLKEGSLN